MSLYGRLEGNTAQDNKILSTTIKDSVDKYRSGATGDPGQTPDYDGSSTVAGAQGYTTAARRVVFIDATEATLAVNRNRGLTAPGWWEYMTYTDAEGKTRHKAQHLVAFSAAPANPPDTDDRVAADSSTPVISITSGNQPASIGNGTSTLEVPATAQTFTVAPTLTGGGSLVYQWQRKTATSDRWVNITATLDSSAYTGFTTGTLTIASGALTGLTLNNYQYRAKVTSTTGAAEVISNAATLKLVDAVP